LKKVNTHIKGEKRTRKGEVCAGCQKKTKKKRKQNFMKPKGREKSAKGNFLGLELGMGLGGHEKNGGLPPRKKEVKREKREKNGKQGCLRIRYETSDLAVCEEVGGKTSLREGSSRSGGICIES